MPSATIAKIAEGKTKEIYSIENVDDQVLIRSKDRLTAFNAARSNDIEGKGAIAAKTTTNVFRYLQACGLETHFVAGVDGADSDFIARKCDMIPIEWVARRIATGSFLKRNPGVSEGYRFNNLMIETFFKDDANDDPQWSEQQIISAQLAANGLVIGRPEIRLMKRLTAVVFQLLEKAWALSDCQLIDMKIEFGVTSERQVLLADVIDNDSWRLWPRGDKRLQLDKQMYRDMREVTVDSLKALVKNYEKVAQLTSAWITPRKTRALVIMGSASDKAFCDRIAATLRQLKIEVVQRVCSAHKATGEVLELLAEFEAERQQPAVVIAVAGRSNGLGPVIAGNSTLPVINAPPCRAESLAQDVWSSLRMPSGMGCTTVVGAEEAAFAAAKILAGHDHLVYGNVLATQFNNFSKIYNDDKALQLS